MTMGEKIKARRLELGMSQEELAHKIGYASKSSINKIEVGERELRQTKIKQVAEVLDVSPLYLIEPEKTVAEFLTPAQQKLLERLTVAVGKLSDEKVDSIIRYINFVSQD